MRFSTQKRAYLELAILKMNDIKLNNEADLVDRIESLEKTVNLLSNQISKGDFRNNRPVQTRSTSFQSQIDLEQIRRQVEEAKNMEKMVQNEPQIEKPIPEQTKIEKTEQNVARRNHGYSSG